MLLSEATTPDRMRTVRNDTWSKTIEGKPIMNPLPSHARGNESADPARELRTAERPRALPASVRFTCRIGKAQAGDETLTRDFASTARLAEHFE